MFSVTRVRGPESKRVYMVTESMSVRGFVNLHVGEEFPTPTLCLYQGRPLLRAQWDITLIEAEVVFLPLPLGGGGGGSNALQMIGMVVVVALAAVATWYLGGAGGALAAAGFSVGAANAIAGAVGTMIAMVGMMAINALFSNTPKLPNGDFNTRSLESASPTYSITSSQNQIRLWQMIPEGFGTNMHVLDLGAVPWLEYANHEQYLYQLMVVGTGEYEVHRISIEDTPVWENGGYTGNFPEVEIQIVNPGERLTLFPDNVETSPEVAGQSLNGGAVLGPFTVNAAGTKASALALDVVFPRGLGWMPSNIPGYNGPPMIGHNVGVLFEYRAIDDYGAPLTGFMTLHATTYNDATQTARRFSHYFNVSPGRYQVQGRITHGDESDMYHLCETVWAGLRAYLPSKAVYPHETVLGVRIRASNSLSQQSARKFQALCTRKLPTWSPESGWSDPVPTNSWPWAKAAMTKAPWGGRRTDRQIDLHTLYRLDQELAARGDEFNQIIDTQMRIWDLFVQVSRCVRVLPRSLGSTLSWLRDAPDRPARGMFTPYNIVRGSFSVDYAFFSDESPDDIIVEYRDRETWTERDVHCALPDSLSMEPARKRWMGITDRAHAYREGCFEAACNAHRRIFPKFSSEMEGRLLFRGDMILLTHPLGGEDAFASVRGWNEEARELKLDAALPWEADGPGRYVVLRRPNGAPWGPAKVERMRGTTLIFDARGLAEAEARALAAEEDEADFTPLWQWLSDGTEMDATAVICGAEHPGRRAIVLVAKPRQNGLCDIECVLEADEVHTADQGDVPPDTPGGTAPETIIRPVVTRLTASLELTAGVAVIFLSWLSAVGARRYHVQYRVKDCEWNDMGETTVTNMNFNVPAQPLEIRVRGLTAETAGPWAELEADAGKPMPLPPALALAEAYAAGRLALTWPAVEAEEITLTLRSSGATVLERVLPGAAVSFLPAAEDFTGGPRRTLEISAVARNGTWLSLPGMLNVADMPPTMPQGFYAEPATAAVRLHWQAVQGEVTGYVVLHVDPLGQVRQYATEALTLDVPAGLGLHSFSVAARDGLYDIIGDTATLNFSPIAEIAL